MDSDEREIIHYLQTWGNVYVSAKEICRRAGTKRRYHEDPDWAKPVLQRLVERKLLESDALGRYRIKPEPRKGHHGSPGAPEGENSLQNGVLPMDPDSEDTVKGKNPEAG